MRRIILFAICFFGVVVTYAQKSFTIKITDAAGQPISGANVKTSGNQNFITDDNGLVSIECGSQSITVSHVGYESKSLAIKNCTDVVVQLYKLEQTLGEVEITATSNPNRQLLYQPASITKLNNAELKRGNGLFLADAINTNVPGVSMQSRTLAAGQQLNIRGYGNGVRGTSGISSNFDMQGTKVYLNGIPLTDAEGITFLDDIDFASVGNAEVVKGPAGTLYGLAIAGVVNLKTIKPEKGKTSIGQDVMIGSYGLKRFTTHIQSGGDRSSILANYGYQHSDGFAPHTASTKRFVNFSGDFILSEKQSLTSYFGYSNSYDERQGELTIKQFESGDYSGNPNYIANNAHSAVKSFRIGVGHNYQFNNWLSNTTTLFGSAANTDAASGSQWTDRDPINFGLHSAFNTQFVLADGTTLTGITGVETQHGYAQTIGYSMKANPANPSGYNIIDTTRSNLEAESGTTSVFTEWTVGLKNDLSFTAGLGWSTMNIILDDRFQAAVRSQIKPVTHFENSYKNMFSPHLAINKVFSKEISAYAAYSRGYKAPVSSYFYIPFVPGAPNTGRVNTGLKAEIADQFEIGSKGSLFNEKLNYQLALFNAIFSNKMTSVAVPLDPNTTAFSYVVNGGKQDDKGVEIAVRYSAFESTKGFFSSIKPFANLTYSDFKYKDFQYQRFKVAPNTTKDSTVNYSGKEVGGVAKIVANIGLDFATSPGLYGNVVYSYRDKSPITSDNLLYSDSYNLLNAKVGFRRGFGHFDVDVFVAANNMTSIKYYYMVFVNQLTDAYVPAPKEINYFGGINLKYNF
jgi:iron complex outermembrane receptor protein